MWPAGGSFWQGLLATEEGHSPEGRSSCGEGGEGAVTWHLVEAQSSLSAGHQRPPLVCLCPAEAAVEAHPHPLWIFV